MFGLRLPLITALSSLLLVSLAFGNNQIRVFVPANEYHAEQELVVGQAGEIYVEVTCDVELVTVVISLEAANLGGATRLWSPITDTDVEFLLPDNVLATRNFLESKQSGDWPDSLQCLGLSLVPPSPLAAGNHLFMKLTVMPTAAGTVVLSDALVGGHWCEYHDGSSQFGAELVAPDITIVQLDDCNENGIPDVQELADGTAFDCNSNGLADECDIIWGTEPDCNLNGVPDACDLSDGPADDCNLNLVPDECDPDLNFNGIPDDCEISEDCNHNGFLDIDDIATGRSKDDNANSVPDECEGLAGNYVQIYGLPGQFHSERELLQGRPGRAIMAIVNDLPIEAAAVPFRFNSADGTPLWAPLTEPDVVFLIPESPGYRSAFLDRQGGDWPDTITVLQSFTDGATLLPGFHPFVEMTVIPTELGTVTWEKPAPTSGVGEAAFVGDGVGEISVDLVAEQMTIVPDSDCNDNGVVDAEEIAEGSVPDCNENGTPDECDLAANVSEDCNDNGIPDACDRDLNANDIPDDCEELVDCNDNGIPDEVDIAGPLSNDTNTNGIPDECEGLAGSFVRMFVPPGQELVVGHPGEIVVALVNGVEIAGATIPFRYMSGDGTPLWEPLVEEDAVFVGDASYPSFLTTRQSDNWPDTLIVLMPLFGDGSLPVGFHSVCRLTVMPTEIGVATFEAASISPAASVMFVDEGGESEFGVAIQAEPVTVLETCCSGVVGNINLFGGDEPTISDVVMLIDHLFVSGVPLDCLAEADVNQSGGENPTYDDITIGDVSALIDFLFISGGSLNDCL